MNAAIRAAILRPQSYSSQLKVAFFHSTTVLERKRRTSWESKSNVHKKRFRRMREKQDLLRNVNAFAANMFSSWHDEFDNDPSSRKQTSWFKKQYSKEPKGNWNGKHGSPSWGKRLIRVEEIWREIVKESQKIGCIDMKKPITVRECIWDVSLLPLLQ